MCVWGGEVKVCECVWDVGVVDGEVQQCIVYMQILKRLKCDCNLLSVGTLCIFVSLVAVLEMPRQYICTNRSLSVPRESGDPPPLPSPSPTHLLPPDSKRRSNSLSSLVPEERGARKDRGGRKSSGGSSPENSRHYSKPPRPTKAKKVCINLSSRLWRSSINSN